MLSLFLIILLELYDHNLNETVAVLNWCLIDSNINPERNSSFKYVPETSKSFFNLLYPKASYADLPCELPFIDRVSESFSLKLENTLKSISKTSLETNSTPKIVLGLSSHANETRLGRTYGEQIYYEALSKLLVSKVKEIFGNKEIFIDLYIAGCKSFGIKNYIEQSLFEQNSIKLNLFTSSNEIFPTHSSNAKGNFWLALIEQTKFINKNNVDFYSKESLGSLIVEGLLKIEYVSFYSNYNDFKNFDINALAENQKLILFDKLLYSINEIGRLKEPETKEKRQGLRDRAKLLVERYYSYDLNTNIEKLIILKENNFGVNSSGLETASSFAKKYNNEYLVEAFSSLDKISMLNSSIFEHFARTLGNPLTDSKLKLNILNTFYFYNDNSRALDNERELFINNVFNNLTNKEILNEIIKTIVYNNIKEVKISSYATLEKFSELISNYDFLNKLKEKEYIYIVFNLNFVNEIPIDTKTNIVKNLRKIVENEELIQTIDKEPLRLKFLRIISSEKWFQIDNISILINRFEDSRESLNIRRLIISELFPKIFERVLNENKDSNLDLISKKYFTYFLIDHYKRLNIDISKVKSTIRTLGLEADLSIYYFKKISEFVIENDKEFINSKWFTSKEKLFKIQETFNENFRKTIEEIERTRDMESKKSKIYNVLDIIEKTELDTKLTIDQLHRLIKNSKELLVNNEKRLASFFEKALGFEKYNELLRTLKENKDFTKIVRFDYYKINDNLKNSRIRR